MQPKLKENPVEWQKFTLLMAIFINVIGLMAYRRRLIPPVVMMGIMVLGGVVLLFCLVRPRWFRGLYRGVMTVSFHVGQVMGTVVLTLFFLVMVTPMGLCLRLLGKDLLHLKKNTKATTYWHPAKSSQEFDRLF